MKFLFDTTYILPLFGLKIKDLSNYSVITNHIWYKTLPDFEAILPTICLTEVMYKLIQEYKKKNDYNILKRYSLTIPTILSSPNLKIFDPQIDPIASNIAMLIRHMGHLDVQDCFIAAGATALNCIFLTEDIELTKKMQDIPETKEIKICNWKKFNQIIMRTIKDSSTL